MTDILPVADKRRVADDFGAAASTYEAAARLQRHVGEALLGMDDTHAPVRHVLDLGCGTGLFLPSLARRYPQAQYLGMDLSAGMLAHACTHVPDHVSRPVHWLQGDADALPLADASVDRVFSSLMIQWCADLQATLQGIQRILRPGGVALISTLADGTLAELADAWARVDPAGGHVNRFLSVAAIRDAAEAAMIGPDGSACGTCELRVERVRLPLDTPMSLLHELKALGARYKAGDRANHLTGRQRLRALCAAYEHHRQPDGILPATYVAVYLVMRRFDTDLRG